MFGIILLIMIILANVGVALDIYDAYKLRKNETLAIDEDCARDADREIRYLLGME